MDNKFKYTFCTLAMIGCLATGFYLIKVKPLTPREKFSKFLKEHPFNNRPRLERESDEENKTDRPDLAWEQDYLRTLDPALGRPAPERLSPIIAKMQNKSLYPAAPGSSLTPWVERGPNNVGGRTRALIFDPNDSTHKKVWAGGATGGLWYNDDITNANSSWIAVNDFWANISVSCIAFDPNNAQIAYVGTGEGFGSGSGRGEGIWKTLDGGNTWNQITSTKAFYYINDIMVRNEGGQSIVYAAVDGNNYRGVWQGVVNAGLQRSINGGSTWAQVLPIVPLQVSNNFVASDIEFDSSNRIWIGTKSNPFGFGGGTILYSDNGTSWTISNTITVTKSRGRVELACAPSNVNFIYAIIEDVATVKTMIKTTNRGTTWSPMTLPIDADTGIPATDFSRGQAWYDLIMAVDPKNDSIIMVGTIDIFRSTNAGNTWSQISKWSNNNNLSGLSCSLVHADQHAMIFHPDSSSIAIFGNDGGVFYCSSLATSATNQVIIARNKNYNVTQFYACAMQPESGSNVYLAGAQDNGTQRFITSGINSTTTLSGGDGAFCFIDQTDSKYQISSFVYNSYRLSTNGGISISKILSSDETTGKFINPADYDDNQHILYSCKNSNSIWRIKNINTIPTSLQTVNIDGMTEQANHIRISPYTTASSTLFVGTDAGDVFKVTNADNINTSFKITGPQFPTGSVSCIETGASENELLVTFSNYGVNSIWYTSNGGQSWVSKEGNLPDMPVRWALFNPQNRNEVLIATELGVWTTTNLNATSPTWTPSNNGMANVRVDMMQIRNADKQVIAATFGRGLFSSNGFGTNSPISRMDPTFYINAKLTMQNGANFYADNNIDLGSFASVSNNGIMQSTKGINTNSNNYINTGTTGFIICPVPPNSAKIFHIGTITNNELIVQHSSETKLNFKLAARNNVYADPEKNTKQITNNVVGKTWYVETMAAAKNVIVTLHWNAGDEIGIFDRNNSAMARWQKGVSTSWAFLHGTNAVTNIGGSNSFNLVSPANNMDSTAYYFGIGGSGSELPIELILFDAKESNENANLTWITVSERNSSHFEIERCKDSQCKTWVSIGSVKASGNSTQTLQYQFKDIKPFQKLNLSKIFYRLKQIDLDNSFLYSAIKEVNLQKYKSSDFEVTSFPNPTSNILNIIVNTNLTEQLTFTIMGLNGTIISKINQLFIPGISNTEVDISKFASGEYIIMVNDSKGKIIFTKKIIIIH
jgi:hypothetical protein